MTTGTAINNPGQVVGNTQYPNSGFAPFLYTPATTYSPATLVNLNSLVPYSGWTLQYAQGINDAGQIVGMGVNSHGQAHAYLLSPVIAGINLKATQTGSSGTTIHLLWNYGDISTGRFFIHRQPPSGDVYIIPVDADPDYCSGSSPDSVCTYDDSAITAYGTYSYTVQAGAYDPPSNTAAVYQLNTYIEPDNPAALFSKFTPDKNLPTVHAVAEALGYDHFDWIQIVTHEPPCNPLHVWNGDYTPKIGAQVVPPHLDPPIGGYKEFGLYEDMCGDKPCAGPSDDLPYFFDENPAPGQPMPWFMDHTGTHFINPLGTLESGMAGFNQTGTQTAQFWDQPSEACIAGSEYMGFVNSLVGVKTGLGELPSTSDVLASYVWNSNYTGEAGSVHLQSTSSWDTPYLAGATGGVFGVSPVDFNNLPFDVRQLMIQNGVQDVSPLPGVSPIPPITGASLSGTQGMNGWYTTPVQVTLIPTDVSGPSNIATTTYNLDSAGAESYTASFTVSTDGVHKVVYGSTDTAGDAETPQPSTTISIDQTPSTSHVAALPASESSPSFTVQWTGTDAGSGIQDYSVFVSDNGSAFTAWQTNNSATSATFTGQASHTYGFYSLARDQAGNVELAKSVADATTAVRANLTTPMVTMSPSPSPATTTQAVTVTIKVSGGSGNPSPTGSVTLTSGSYISSPATLNGGSAIINIAASSLVIGSNLLSAAYTPDTASSSTYTAASGTATVTIQGYPVITWATPAAIPYGTPLSATQLDATASVAGLFTYVPSSGTVPTAGLQTLTATFTPTDTTDYTTATGSVQLTVNKATPVIAWAAPAAIFYGTALSATQLNATSTAAGSFAYSPSLGTVPTAGLQTLTATFTPTDAIDFTGATQNVQIMVNQATPTVTWNAPAAITYGTALSGTQLDATASFNNAPVAGTFVYAPPAGTVPSAGLHTLSVIFTSSDTVDYSTPKAVTTTIMVNQATLDVTANSATRIYGTANPAFTGSVTGTENNNSFTETFATTATISSNVGSYPIVPSVTGAGLSDYTEVVTDGTLTITQAASSTSLIASATSITPGQPLTLTAAVTSTTTSTPTGSVTFYDNAISLGTITLKAGAASFTTSALAPGITHTISATYSGDMNFTTSSTTASLTVTVASLEFTLTINGATLESVYPGGTATYTFNVAPEYGAYADTMNFSISGLPSGITATFSPDSIAANGGPQTVTLTITDAALSSAASPPTGLPKRIAPFALALLLLPLLGAGRMRRHGRRMRQVFCVLLLAGGALSATVLTGCGSANGFFAQAPQDYKLTITATAGTVQKSATVTLNVQ
jgi:probable HAF family extracellular repeat protein